MLPNNKTRRVVLTGVGLITPLGTDKDSFWNSLTNGRSGLNKIQSFDTSDYGSKIGGESDFNPDNFIDRFPVLRTLDKASQLGLCVAYSAIKDSRINLDTVNKQNMGVIMGTTSGASSSFASYHTKWLKEGLDNVARDDIAKHRHESISNSISSEFGLQGCSVLVGTACSAGTYAIGEAFDLIRSGKLEIILAGGTDAMSEISHCGFNALRSLTKTQCKPFDKTRDGMAVSEGAAVVVLETLESALERKASIYAEIIGYGLSCDAEHMTKPQITGETAALSMEMALQDASITPKDIDYINAHGTATPLNDIMETNGIKRVFGEYADKIPISSIKSMLGHTFGAAGTLEAITCALAITSGIIPPTINYAVPDPECNLDYVPNTARNKEIRIALSNSFAFGGNNASLILRKSDE